MWALGDWVLDGEQEVFKSLKRAHLRRMATEISGYSSHTIAMAVSVSRRVSVSIRIDGLTWWHHLAVAKMVPEDQLAWLTRAAEECWSVARLRAELRAAGMLKARSRPRSASTAIEQLVRLRREDIPPKLLDHLTEWWQREVATSP
jgi:hypothetical protein